MTPALVQQLEKAELSVCDAAWPDTRYRTVRRLSNHEAAEKAAQTAEHFYEPLLTAIRAVFAAEQWEGGILINENDPAISNALDALGRIYDEINRATSV